MYVERQPGDRLAYGDIVKAKWLFDAYVRPDSAALAPKTFPNGLQGFITRAEPAIGEDDPRVLVQATMDPEDVAFGYGNLRAAIVLTDDCEMASAAGQRGPEKRVPKGRILLASIRRADPAKIEAQKKRGFELGFHPLDPHVPADPNGESLFEGGLVDFNYLFSAQAITMISRPDAYERRLGLTREAQLAMTERWAGHALRHGPIAAKLGTLKFAQLLSANGDAERLAELVKTRMPGDAAYDEAATATLAALHEAWKIEGPLLDDIDLATERAESPVAYRARMTKSLEIIRGATDAALAALGEPSWNPEDARSGQ